MLSAAGQRSTPAPLPGFSEALNASEGFYMIGSAFIHIIRVNDPRSGVKDGRAWQMQDAECVLLNDDGTPSQVGVLQLPKEMMGDKAPKVGYYTGAFALKAGMRDRRIEAVLTSLQPAQDRIRTQQSPAKP